MVMMAVRFPSESCPTWEPFNLVSKDKKEGQMLSLFYSLTSFLSQCRPCGHAHTYTKFPLNHSQNAECQRTMSSPCQRQMFTAFSCLACFCSKSEEFKKGEFHAERLRSRGADQNLSIAVNCIL
jgi:hypothetical protein